MFIINLEYADRVGKLPKYIFAEIEELTLEKKKQGTDLIPLGIGDPDLTAPQMIVDEIIDQVKVPENQNYPSSMGEEDFRKTIAHWYNVR
ncbi:MAG: LL-diaminopimelate aminotransferase, partial [Promethearchaeia archaeon]